MNPGIASAGAEAPSTDLEALARLERFGGQRLLNEMIALFLRSAPERLSAAAAGVAAGDASATENALHALKASSAQLGALRLSRLCDEGEAIARSGALASIAELIDAGRRELDLVEAWLNRVRTERPA
jgi:HPt (histidine-containing phosphotransfer) domain-containing protein